MIEIRLPEPVSNSDSALYWKGAVEGHLLLRRCLDCGGTHFMPRYMCPECWSERLDWFQASGMGTIYSFTIIWRASDPAFREAVPYVVALIDLEEGPRMTANILGDGALDCAIGDTVSVVFEKRGENSAVPQFELAK